MEVSPHGEFPWMHPFDSGLAELGWGIEIVGAVAADGTSVWSIDVQGFGYAGNIDVREPVSSDVVPDSTQVLVTISPDAVLGPPRDLNPLED